MLIKNTLRQLLITRFSKLLILSLITFQCEAAMSHQAVSKQNLKPTKEASSKELPNVDVSIQLWSVREDLKRDFSGTLKAIADMGFDAVEFAGEFGPFADDPVALRAFLDSLGLKANSAHAPFSAFGADNIEQSLLFYKALGAEILIVGYDQRAFALATVDQTIADLNRVYAKAKTHGIKFGYHNHAEEFATVEGKTLWDRIAEGTPDDLVLQLDVSWVTKAGKDPIEYVRKYPGRTLVSHFKAAAMNADKGEIPIIGADSINWPCLLDSVYRVGGAKWIVLEQEEYPNNLTAMQSAKLSKLALDGFVARYQAGLPFAEACAD